MKANLKGQEVNEREKTLIKITSVQIETKDQIANLLVKRVIVGKFLRRLHSVQVGRDQAGCDAQ